MLKFAHIADLHLDAPLTQISNEASQILREKMRGQLLQFRDFLIVNNVQLVLISGDLFDAQYISKASLKSLLAMFEGAKETEFYIAAGNHDYLCSASPFVRNIFPQNVHIFEGDKVDCIYSQKLQVNIWGKSATRPYSSEQTLENFKVLDENMINIMTLHSFVTEDKNCEYMPITTSQIGNSGLDYLALGHVHSFNGIEKVKKTSYCYAGCFCGRGFDEIGDKGFVLLEIEKVDGEARINSKFIGNAPIQFVVQNVDISSCNDSQEIAEFVAREVSVLPQNILLKVVLKGEIDPYLSIVNEIIQERLTRFIFAKINDDTSIFHNAYELAGESGVVGMFAKRMLEKSENKSEQEKDIINTALKLGLLALNGERVSFYENK